MFLLALFHYSRLSKFYFVFSEQPCLQFHLLWFSSPLAPVTPTLSSLLFPKFISLPHSSHRRFLLSGCPLSLSAHLLHLTYA